MEKKEVENLEPITVVNEITDDDLVWLEQQKVEKATILDWLADH